MIQMEIGKRESLNVGGVQTVISIIVFVFSFCSMQEKDQEQIPFFPVNTSG